jgi:hypothetical protein
MKKASNALEHEPWHLASNASDEPIGVSACAYVRALIAAPLAS